MNKHNLEEPKCIPEKTQESQVREHLNRTDVLMSTVEKHIQKLRECVDFVSTRHDYPRDTEGKPIDEELCPLAGEIVYINTNLQSNITELDLIIKELKI